MTPTEDRLTADGAQPTATTHAPLVTRLLVRYRRILGEGAWVIFGQAASVVGGLVGTRVLIQFVPPDAFGQVALLLGVATFVKNVTVMPLAHAGTRYYPDLAIANGLPILDRVIRHGLRIAWAVFAFLLVAGVAYCAGSGKSVWLLVVVAAFFAQDVVRTIDVTYLNAARRQRNLGLWTALDAWLRPALAILAALAIAPTAGPVLLGYAVASIALLAVFHRSARRIDPGPAMLPAAAAADWTFESLARQIRQYALPLVPLSAVLWINSISDRYIIQWLRGPDDVGIYAAAYALVSAPFLMAQTVVTQTLRPVYLQALATNNVPHMRRTFAVWMGSVAAVCAVGFVLVLLLRNWIGLIFLSHKFRGGVQFMPWVALAYAIYATGQVLASYLLAHKRTAAWMVAETIGAVVSIPLTFVMVRSLGPKGAAMACPIYCSVIFLAQAVMILLPARRGGRTPDAAGT